MMKKRTAIFGGAFSPPHIGHASVIEAVTRLFPCDEVWLMPSADRKDKKIGVPAEHRVKMLRLLAKELFAQSPVRVAVSRLEVDRPRHTTTYETHRELAECWPDREFHFVVSSELLPAMTKTWKFGKELWSQARFVVMERSGTMLDPKLVPPKSTVIDRSYAWIEVSSTFIRGLVQKGLPATPYLTPSVARYVREHALYRD